MRYIPATAIFGIFSACGGLWTEESADGPLASSAPRLSRIQIPLSADNPQDQPNWDEHHDILADETVPPSGGNGESREEEAQEEATCSVDRHCHDSPPTICSRGRFRVEVTQYFIECGDQEPCADPVVAAFTLGRVRLFIFEYLCIELYRGDSFLLEDSEEYADLAPGGAEEIVRQYGLAERQGIPIIYSRTLNGGRWTGLATYPWYNLLYVALAARGGNRNLVEDWSIVAHEIGHLHGLLHTQDTKCGAEPCVNGDCNQRGDLICDPPPDPGNCGIVVEDDEFRAECQSEDCNPDPHNFMSYYGCRNAFSSTQERAMYCWAEEIDQRQ